MSLKNKIIYTLDHIWMKKEDREVLEDELKAMGPGIAPKELKK